VLSLSEAMDPLIDYYKRFPDENPDWDDYRARMERERRVLIHCRNEYRCAKLKLDARRHRRKDHRVEP
jgi:hypothetical protein